MTNSEPIDQQRAKELPDYKIGLVFSQAGLNGNQTAVIKQHLKMIAKTWLGRETGGISNITVTVPGWPHDGIDAGVRMAERLVLPLLSIDYVRVVIAKNTGAAEECVRLFADHDEVWCASAERQSKATKARPLQVYNLGMSAPDQYRKYKLIPPWVEPAVAEARDPKKPKAMKGYL